MQRSPLDVVHVDVNAEQSTGMCGPIQLPPGVGELIPNLLFIGPHTACESMVSRFGVRYVIDVFEDKELVASAAENGYVSKLPELLAEVSALREQISVLEREEVAALGNADSSEDEESDEPHGVEKEGAENKEGVVVVGKKGADDEEGGCGGDDDTPLPPPSAASHEYVAPYERVPSAVSVEEAVEAKRRYLQAVADLTAAKEALTAAQERKARRNGHAVVSGAGSAAVGCSYARVDDCKVVSPVSATTGYVVSYPPTVTVLHQHMRDVLVEDLTIALNMGKSVIGGHAVAKVVDEVAEEDDSAPASPNSEGGGGRPSSPNGFVTMEELLKEYPPPVYSPPYALVEYIDAILSQNPSSCELQAMAVAAMRKQASAFRANAEREAALRGVVAASPTGTTEAEAPSSPLLAMGSPVAQTFAQQPAITRHAVFLHCFAGKSRSASIAIAYVMMSAVAGNKPLDEVMDLLAYMTPLTIKRPKGYVVRRGQGCRPNPRFMRDLMALEEGVQGALQASSGIPPSRRRPFETSFDIDTFNVEGLIELFSTSPAPQAQIPEAVVVDTYEKVCHGDVIRARRLLLAEQTRLLVSPSVRHEMLVDNVARVLAQDVDYYILERQKIKEAFAAAAAAASEGGGGEGAEAAAAQRKAQLEARLKEANAGTVTPSRDAIAEVLEACGYCEDGALAKLRAMRDSKVRQLMQAS